MRGPGPKTSAGPLFFTTSILFLGVGPLLATISAGSGAMAPLKPPLDGLQPSQPQCLLNMCPVFLESFLFFFDGRILNDIKFQALGGGL